MTAPVRAMTILSRTEDTLGGRRRTGARLPARSPTVTMAQGDRDQGPGSNASNGLFRCTYAMACDVAAARVLRRSGRRAQLHCRGRLPGGGPTDPEPAVQGPGGRAGRAARSPHPRCRHPDPGRRRRAAAGPAHARRPGGGPGGGGRAGGPAARTGTGGRHTVAVHRRAGRRAARLPRAVPGDPPRTRRERVTAAGQLTAAQRDRHRSGDRAGRRPRCGAAPHTRAAGATVRGLSGVEEGAVEPGGR